MDNEKEIRITDASGCVYEGTLQFVNEENRTIQYKPVLDSGNHSTKSTIALIPLYSKWEEKNDGDWKDMENPPLETQVPEV